jgi:hypothetical protein
MAQSQSQPTATDDKPIYDKLRSSHKLPKWAESACFYDGMHDQIFFVMGSDGGHWSPGRLGGVRLRQYENGLNKPEIHLRIDHSAETGASKYFFSDPYQPRGYRGWARWQLVIDWDTNRFFLKSVSVNTGKNLFDESGRCMEVQSQ